MSRKIIGIIIIVLALLLMAGVVYVIFYGKSPIDLVVSWFNREPSAVEVAPGQDSPGAGGNNAKSADKPIKVITVEEGAPDLAGRPAAAAGVTKDDLARLAASFAERFGTYSNQSNFTNVVDLKLFMSAEMKVWADGFIAEQRSRRELNDLYYGITTKSIATEALEFDDDLGIAKVMVNTRRREAAGAIGNQSDSFNQDIVIEFTKENGAWKVKNAFWQN